MAHAGPTAETGPAPGASSRRHSVLIGAGIFLSRISGLLRERAIASFLGTSFAVDAFRVALRIPNTLQNLLGEGVLSASFIPVYSRLLAAGRRDDARRLAGATVGLLAALTGVLALIGVAFAEPLTDLLAPGFTGPRRTLTVALVRILTPGIGFLVLSAWCLGVLNSHRRFFLSYVAPVVWNVAQIAVLVGFGLTMYRAVLAAPADSAVQTEALSGLAMALAWGTLVGGVAQFGVQLPSVLRLVPHLRPTLRRDTPGLRETVGAFGPVVAGRGVVQLSAYVDLMLASYLATGAPAALGYAQALYLLPISLFGMSVAAAELPELSSTRPDDNLRLERRLDDGLERIAFFVVPCAVAYIVIGELVVGALYQTGRFGAAETRQVWLILMGYSVGLLASTASRLLQSALYAFGQARTAAFISAARVLVSVAIGGLLMLQFDRLAVLPGGGIVVSGALPAFRPLPVELRSAQQGLRLGALGLSLAAGATAWLEYALLRRALRRRLTRVQLGGGQLGRTLAAAGVAAVAALGLRLMLVELPALAAGPLAALGTGAAYLLAASALGLPEVTRALDGLRRRIRHSHGPR